MFVSFLSCLPVLSLSTLYSPSRPVDCLSPLDPLNSPVEPVCWAVPTVLLQTRVESRSHRNTAPPLSLLVKIKLKSKSNFHFPFSVLSPTETCLEEKVIDQLYCPDVSDRDLQPQSAFLLTSFIRIDFA